MFEQESTLEIICLSGSHLGVLRNNMVVVKTRGRGDAPGTPHTLKLGNLFQSEELALA